MKDRPIPEGEQNHHFYPRDLYPGWTAPVINVGYGIIYNPLLKGTMVIQFDTNQTRVCQQVRNLTQGIYSLSFRWAAFNGQSQNTRMKVTWDSRIIGQFRIKQADTRTERIDIREAQSSFEGHNLCFQSCLNGTNFKKGAIFTDVALVKIQYQDEFKNYVKNGLFALPQFKQRWKIFREFRFHWESPIIEIGYGTVFSAVWPEGMRVCQLKPNQHYHPCRQQLRLDQVGFYQLSFNWAPSQGFPMNGIEVHWNDKIIRKVMVEHEAYIVKIKIEAVGLKNRLEFKGYGKAPARRGTCFSNIKLTRQTNFEPHSKVQTKSTQAKSTQTKSTQTNHIDDKAQGSEEKKVNLKTLGKQSQKERMERYFASMDSPRVLLKAYLLLRGDSPFSKYGITMVFRQLPIRVMHGSPNEVEEC